MFLINPCLADSMILIDKAVYKFLKLFHINLIFKWKLGGNLHPLAKEHNLVLSTSLCP